MARVWLLMAGISPKNKNNETPGKKEGRHCKSHQAIKITKP
jgi:hypothetical protein